MGAVAPQAPRLTAGLAYEQRLLLGLGAVIAAAAPLCLFFGTRGFAPVVGVAGLLCLPWARPRREDWTGVLILAALVLWAAISVAWSPAPNLRQPHTLKAVSRFTVLHLAMQLAFCTAFVTTLARLDARRAGKVLSWTAFGVLVAEPLLIEESLTGARLYQALPALIHQPIRADWLPANLAQGGYIVAVLAWPLGIALCKQGRPFLALVLAATVPLSMVLIRGVAPTVALAVSLPCFFIVLRYGRRAVTALAALSGCSVTLAFRGQTPGRWRGRRAGLNPRSGLRPDCSALLAHAGPALNSRRSLRSLCSDKRAESDHEARCARGPRVLRCSTLGSSCPAHRPRHRPPGRTAVFHRTPRPPPPRVARAGGGARMRRRASQAGWPARAARDPF